MKLYAKSVSGNLPITIQYPSRAIGLVCFGVKQLPTEKMSAKFESEIINSYDLAEFYIPKETKLDREEKYNYEDSGVLSISGEELLILLTDLLRVA